VRLIPFSCFTLLDSFSTKPRASGPVFMFCPPRLIFDGTEGVESHFHVYAPGLISGGTEGVVYCFHALHSRTRFRRYLGHWLPCSYFALSESFWAVSRVPCSVFIFCAPELVFGRYRASHISFSCFALPDLFSNVPRVSGPIFVFCAPGLISRGTEGVWYSFLLPDPFSAVLRALGPVFKFCALEPIRAEPRAPSLILMFHAPEQVFDGTESSFSCSALSDSFSAVLRASGPVFLLCPPGLVFDGSKGVDIVFMFAIQDSFGAVSRASSPIFMFCAPVLIFDGTRASGPVFLFYAPGLVFDDTEGVRFRFHALRSLARFGHYRWRRVQFSCFCALGLVLSATKGVRSHFHVFPSRTHFRRYRGRRVLFSCFALPNLFLTITREPGRVFMFRAPRLIFDCSEGVGSHFRVLRTRTHFRRYRGRRVSFSYFPLPNTFRAEPRAPNPIF
jgi:hypothetical protein